MPNYYTSKTGLPMSRKIYPGLIIASDIDTMCDGKVRDRVWDDEVELLRGCRFLSRNRIKERLKYWKPFRGGGISIVVVEYENHKPTRKTVELFVFPDRKDDFMVELANISDLHGIIKMREGEIWLRKVSDTRELNIDATTMNRIFAKLGLERV